MKKISIVIRADGGGTLGMGHIMRTSVLAKVLSEHAMVSYLCDHNYTQGITYLEQEGFKVYQVEADSIITQIECLKPDIMITDHYDIDTKYIEKVRTNCDKVVYIDDNCEKIFDADLILNQNFGAESLQYCNATKKDFIKLLGSQYILIREAFRKVQPIRIREKVQHILISVGGGDPYNITDEILNQVVNTPYIFHVVIGGNFPYEEQLRKKYKGKTIHFYKQPEMSELMVKMDIAISSCGTTLYELGVLGIPTLGLIVADNQKELAYRMNEQELIWLIGSKEELPDKNLGQMIELLVKSVSSRKNMWEANTHTFNREGVYIVAGTILNLIKDEGEEDAASNSWWETSKRDLSCIWETNYR